MLMRRRALMVAAMGGDDDGLVPVGEYDGVVNLVHVYEPARCTLTAYDGTELIRLRRASDDAEANFTNVSTADQELDLAAIAAWAGGASYVVTIYDQVGNDDVTQATDANQPLFTANAKNGHAGLTFDGANHYLQGAFTNGGALSQPFSIYIVAQVDASAIDDGAGHYVVDGDDGVGRMVFGKIAGVPDTYVSYAGANLVGGTVAAGFWLSVVLFNGASSEYWINGASNASGNTGGSNADGLTVGAKNDAALFWKGLVTSVIIADPAHSDAQRIALQTIINAYWAVY